MNMNVTVTMPSDYLELMIKHLEEQTALNLKLIETVETLEKQVKDLQKEIIVLHDSIEETDKVIDGIIETIWTDEEDNDCDENCECDREVDGGFLDEDYLYDYEKDYLSVEERKELNNFFAALEELVNKRGK